MNLKDYLQLTVERNASDLHLVTGSPPVLRVEGELFSVPGEPVLTGDDVSSLLKEFLRSDVLERLNQNKEVDFSIAFSDLARFRANVYTQKGTWAAAFRRIPLTIPTVDSLGLPKIMHSIAAMRQGFVLVTGPTGHGKSTTLASLIQEINQTRSCHIVTIEDPVEFVFHSQKSIISQREMHQDTHSWSIALRSVLREDPDVVLVGEMRDFETIAAALTIAETGHLVFATLHTNSAAQSIDRIVDVFPDEQQSQIKLQLSNVIEAVVSQRLMPGIGKGRVLGYEIMLGTTAVRTTIREGKTHLIDGIIETSQEVGMVPLEQNLANSVRAGKVTLETAQSFSTRPEILNRLVRTA